MWPAAGSRPKFAESMIVNLADKLCATAEVLHIYHLLRMKSKLFCPSRSMQKKAPPGALFFI